MPAKLDRCVQHLIAQGKTEDQAWAICAAQMDEAVLQMMEEAKDDTPELKQTYREVNALKKFKEAESFRVVTIHYSEGVKVIIGENKKPEKAGYTESHKSIRGFLFNTEKWDEAKIDKFLEEEWKVEDVEATKESESCLMKHYQLDSKPELTEGNFLFEFNTQHEALLEKYQEDADWFYFFGQANVEEISRNGPFVMTKDAFRESIPEYMENPKILFQHGQYAGWLFPSEKDETAYSIGESVEAGVNDIGPWIISKISKDEDITPLSVQKRMKTGLIHTLSVGVIIHTEEHVCVNENACFSLMDKLSWLETSVVEIPASRHSQFKIIQNLSPDSQFKQYLAKNYDLASYGLGDIPKGPGLGEEGNGMLLQSVDTVEEVKVEEPERGTNEMEETKEESNVAELQLNQLKLEQGLKEQIGMAEAEKEKIQAEKEALANANKELEAKVLKMEQDMREKRMKQDMATLIDSGSLTPNEQEGWSKHLSTLSEEQYGEALKLLEARKVLDTESETPNLPAPKEQVNGGEMVMHYAHRQSNETSQEAREKQAASLIFTEE